MEPIFRNTGALDWITVIIFLSLFFVVITKSMFYHRLLNFLILPFNNKYIFLYNKKDTIWNWFHFFMTLFQLLNFSLFIFLAVNIVYEPINNAYPYIYVIIFGLLLFFLICKVLLQLGNGFIFSNTRVIADFIFQKLSYFNYSSFVMFLANVILIYILKDSPIVIYISISLILLINFIGWITILKNHQNYFAGNFFYFILYLCALEIAPLVILGSYLKE